MDGLSSVSTATQILMWFNVLLGLGACVISAAYFMREKTTWRWIKLAYSLSTGIFTITLVKVALGYPISGEGQMLLISLLLATILGGLIVSWAKLDAAKAAERKIKSLVENGKIGE